MFDRNLRKLLALSILSKACIVAVILLGSGLFLFHKSNYQLNFRYPADAPIYVATHFKTWDAQHYLFLAERGYAPGQESNRFFPLFPFLIRLAGPLFFGNLLMAGLVISNVFSLILIAVLYLLVKQLFDERTAFVTGILLLAFPTGFYMSLVYTESLLMMLAVSFFYCLYNRRFVFACLLAFLLPLSRPQGILAAGALFVFILNKIFKERGVYRGIASELLIFPAFGAGLLLYFLIIQSFTGDMMNGLNLHKQLEDGALMINAGNHSIANLFDPVGWYRRNIDVPRLILHDLNNGILDRFFFVGFVSAVLFSFRRINATLLTYMLMLGLVPVLSGGFMSYTRYMLQVFPLFITLALMVRERHIYITIPMMVLQTVFLILHSKNFWVS